MVRDFSAAFRQVSLTLAVAATVGIAPLAGCGVKGPLKLPQPAAPTAGTLPAEPPASSATPATQPTERKP